MNNSILFGTPKIVMIGMSYCAEWSLNLSEDFKVINKGLNGDLTNGMKNRFQKDVVAEKPDFVLIWGFSNDITTGDRRRIGEIRENIKDNISGMVSTARQHQISPILATQLTISYKKSLRELIFLLIGKLFHRESYTDFANREIHRVNRWLKEYARENNIPLLDLEMQLSNRWGFRKFRYTTPDGSHVTEAGYRKLTVYARPVLMKFLTTAGKKEED
jgi:lysophospholipase L1-like esterase